MTRAELLDAIERSEARTTRLRRMLADFDTAEGEEVDREFAAILERLRPFSGVNIKTAAAMAGTSERTAYRFARFVGEKRGHVWVLDEALLRDLVANRGETGALTLANPGEHSN